MAGDAKRSGGGRGKSAAGSRGAGRKGGAVPDDEPRVDTVLGDLEQVVDELESGDLPLEEALARFERGVRLAKDGARMLDDMERRVEVLLADGDDDDARAPFEAESETEHDEL